LELEKSSSVTNMGKSCGIQHKCEILEIGSLPQRWLMTVDADCINLLGNL
jgi:hypothetical protein